MDLNLPWCTYRTQHTSGIFYEGKGITQKVSTGAYTGSGVRYKLACTVAGYEPHTWTTTILATYATQGEAYSAEEVLVPIESLADPRRLNMNAGGLKGKYQGHGALLKKMNSVKKAANKKLKADKAKAKIALLKQKLKEKK